MSDATADVRAFRALGYCSLGLYCILAVLFWNSFTSTKTRADDVLVFVATVALVVLYFYGLRYVRRCKASLIVAFAVGFGIIGFLSVPFDSADVFFYMAMGWQQSHYDNNPYSSSLRDIEKTGNDPMVDNEWIGKNSNQGWLDLPLPYGFLFALISRGIAWLGHGNLWLTLVIFNLLNLSMHAGTALLLWKAARFLPETSANVVLYLYTWSPFVVLQYLANVHNDILVAFLVVLAAYLLLCGRTLWTLPTLLASGLIKYVTLILIPFAFIFLVRRPGWTSAIRSLLLAAAIAIVTAVPYLCDLGAFKYRLIAAQLSESTGSLHAFILYSYRMVGRLWPALLDSIAGFRSTTQIGLWVLFAVFVIRELYACWAEGSLDPLRLVQRWTSILFALIFVASSQFFAWYIGMLFPLVLLTNRKSILADTVVLLTGAHMLSFTFLRRKAIGYFLVATLLPVLYIVMVRYKRKVAPSVLFPAL